MQGSLFCLASFPEGQFRITARDYAQILKGKPPAHPGYDPGVDTFATFDPKKKTGVVIILNAPIIQLKGVRICHKMIRKLFSEAKNSD